MRPAGYYTAAVKVKTVLVGVANIHRNGAFAKSLSYYIEQKRHDEFRKVTAKAMKLVVMMALPLVVYFIIYAREAILVLSGADYIPAIIPMHDHHADGISDRSPSQISPVFRS